MKRTINMREPRATRAGGAVTPRLLRALAAGTGAGILAGSAPGWLLESLTLASGLASVFPPAAPPLGLTARLLIAIASAAVALVLVWTLWRSRGESAPAAAMAPGMPRQAAPAINRPAAKVAEPVTGGLLGGLKAVLGGRAHSDPLDGDEEREALLARRRADLHPDAPPRPPLVASRDLPDIEAMPVRKRSLVAAQEASAPVAEQSPAAPDPAMEVPAPVPPSEPMDRPAMIAAAPEPASFQPFAFDLHPTAASVVSPLEAFTPADPAPMPFKDAEADAVIGSIEAAWPAAAAAAPAVMPHAFEPIDLPAFLPPEPDAATVPFSTGLDDDGFTPARSLGQVPQEVVSLPGPQAWLVEAGSDTASKTLAEPEAPSWALPHAAPGAWEPVPEAPAATDAPTVGMAADPVADRDPLPPLPADDLTTLAARFEAGVARREAINNAEAAARSLEARIALADQDDAVRNALRSLRPMAAVPDLVPAPARSAGVLAQAQTPPAGNIDQHVDIALEQALGTLRKLSELGRR